MLRNLLILAGFALTVYAFVDCLRSRPEERGGVATPVWIALILLLPIAGPVIWLMMSRRARAAAVAAEQRRRSLPRAPDDDPAFLAELERRARRAEREARRESPEGSEGSAPDDDSQPRR